MFKRPIQLGDLILPFSTQMTSDVSAENDVNEFAYSDGGKPFIKRGRIKSKSIKIFGDYQESDSLPRYIQKYTKEEFRNKLHKLQQKTINLFVVDDQDKIYVQKVKVSLAEFPDRYANGFEWSLTMIGYDVYFEDLEHRLWYYLDYNSLLKNQFIKYDNVIKLENNSELKDRLELLNPALTRGLISTYSEKLFHLYDAKTLEGQIVGETLLDGGAVEYLLEGGTTDYSLLSTTIFDVLPNDTYEENGFLVIPVSTVIKKLKIVVTNRPFPNFLNGSPFALTDYISSVFTTDLPIDELKVRFAYDDFNYYETDLTDYMVTLDKIGNPTSLNSIQLLYRNSVANNIRLQDISLNKLFAIGYDYTNESNVFVKSDTGRCRVEIIAIFQPNATKKIMIDDETFTVDSPYVQVIDSEIRTGNDWSKLTVFKTLNKVIEKDNFTIGFDSNDNVDFYYKVNNLFL